MVLGGPQELTKIVDGAKRWFDGKVPSLLTPDRIWNTGI